MKTPMIEGGLEFTFTAETDADHYDRWKPEPAGTKVDFLAVETGLNRADTPWLIEVKDFRIINFDPNPKNYTHLAITFCKKVSDTLTALPSICENPAYPEPNRELARRAAITTPPRAVLHFEPYAGDNPLFDYLKSTPANILIKLEKSLRTLAPNPIILSLSTSPTAGVPWSVRSMS